MTMFRMISIFIYSSNVKRHPERGGAGDRVNALVVYIFMMPISEMVSCDERHSHADMN